ncbi:polyprenyl synthetase family protein [Actinomyces sp. B33]|uniref:polyprenyl synthetase family protein n=1 Tax=Actinomyces sp. B33 TaxID=2942131 RepID=UPI002341EEAC|nr:polyprenyl synthetase family protein [Actinomyces sp. B33]MDC4232943.1 polyprenyl synthetase family protein [Actinomyces sp. B33]
MTPLAQGFAALRPAVDLATADALDETISSFADPCSPTEIFSAARTAAAGGKRFRGLLAHLGRSLVSGAPIDRFPVGPLSAALELYQASALVHDDLIDHSPTRRSLPTPHVALARIHSDRGWTGDDREFGSSAALLVGDLLFSAAERAVARSCADLAPAAASRLLLAYSRMHAEVAYGQYLDLRAEQLPLDPSDDEAISTTTADEVNLHKSARYSIVHPTLLGAIAAGADDALLGDLESILTPWGLAFQMRDDDLGVFGDPDLTGKPAGGDIREGKRTALLAIAWAEATRAEREALASALGRADLDDVRLEEARSVIDQRARAAHEGLIDALVDRGRRALDSSRLDEAARAVLAELAEIVVVRRA